MSFRRRPLAHLPARGRPALRAACAAALMLSGCLSGCGDNDSGGSSQAGFVKGDDGFDTVPVAARKPAPAIDGRTTHGDPLNIADYKGKVVVLNIWGSWCGPCIAEAPGFAEVAEENRSKGVQFVGINTRDSSTAQAISFEERHELPYPSLFDPSGKLMLRFPKGSLNPQFLPSTIVVDRHGRTAARAIGPLGEQQLRKMIQPLTAED
ncbi:TlpA family protein disulfide reductase [Streptomyces sclerotialus]|uniref:TlpA family protein disulfide reductase n=1 Tax=Streptomyces sclerotialus TaxID=1957 RepID=UPI0004CA4C63